MRIKKRATAITGVILLVILTVIGTRTYGIFQEIKMLKTMEVVLDRFPRSDLNESETYSLELSSYLIEIRQGGLRSGYLSGFCCRLVDLYDSIVQ